MALHVAFRAVAQIESPVYVDDSPLAWEMFQRAADQQRDNAAESVRLYQQLLDDYGTKLIPVAINERDRFFSVRTRVLEALRSDAELLSRYQLIEQAPAERMMQAGELSKLAATRSLTAPGLEALLQLGQRELESARFRAAIRLLEEAMTHPNLSPRQDAHASSMTAMAAHYLGDTALRDRMRQRLVLLQREGEAFLHELDRLMVQTNMPSTTSGITPFDNAPNLLLDEFAIQEIWSRPLTETLPHRRAALQSSGGDSFGVSRRRRGEPIVTTAATVTPNAVFINEGHVVRAFDRFTGFELWPAPFRDRLAVTVTDPEDGSEVGELNVLTAADGVVVTMTGHAGAAQRSSDGQIVCLDAATGTPRWSVRLNDVLAGEEHQGLYPYGVPIVVEQSVIVLARKQSQQLLTSEHVVALDMWDGSLKWVRHVASSAVIPIRQARSLPRLVEEAGVVYVSTPVGAAVAIEADLGSIRWLRVHRPGVSEASEVRRAWETAGVALTGRGVLAIQPDGRRVGLFDRMTGEVLESHGLGTEDGWGQARYLLADDRFVVAVGADVRVFGVDDLSRRLWRWPGDDRAVSVAPGEVSDSGASREASGDRGVGEALLTGRVQLAGESLLIPSTAGLQIVDVETGVASAVLASRAGVVPVADGEQVFLTGAEGVEAWMAFGAAEGVLRRRMAAEPESVEPVFSLLRLGLRGGQAGLALEAAGKARGLLEAAERRGGKSVGLEQSQGQLFGMVLECVQSGLGATREEESAMHAMLRSVARTPEQQVEQLLAFGAWCAGESDGSAGGNSDASGAVRLSDAVEAYQTILDHTVLAQTEREVGGVIKSARSWAIDRMGALLQRTDAAGAGKPLNEHAQSALERLGAETDVTRLMALTLRFPFSEAAGEAAIRAAAMLDEMGLERDALAMIEGVWQRTPGGLHPASGRLIGEAVERSVRMGWRDHAAQLLRETGAGDADAMVEVAGGSRLVSDWLTELGAQATDPPTVGAQRGGAHVVNGVLLLGQRQWLGRGAERVVLVQSGELVRGLRWPDLSEMWSSRLGSASWEVLGEHDGAAIVWQRTPVTDARAVAIDLKDGSVRWSTPSLEQVGRNAGEQIRRERGSVELMPNGTPLNPAEILPLLTQDTLLLVRRTGVVHAVDLRLGEPVVTIAGESLTEVHEAMVSDVGLTLIGRGMSMGQGTAAGTKQPLILLLDVATGETLLRVEPTASSGVLWAKLTTRDELVYGTDAGVELVNLLSGERRWRQHSASAVNTRRGWVAEHSVLIEDPSGSLRSIALETGSLSEPFHRPRSGFGGESSPLVDVLVDRGRVYAHYADRVVRVDEDGLPLGADAISDERDYRWLLAAKDRLVLVSKVGAQQVFVAGAPNRTEHFYRMYTLSESGAVLEDGPNIGEPNDGLAEPIRDASLVDDWLFVSTGSATIALSMPSASR